MGMAACYPSSCGNTSAAFHFLPIMLPLKNGMERMKGRIETRKMPQFSHQCFWDMDCDKLDFNKGKNYIISRVIQNGNDDDVIALFAYYGSNTIKEEVVKIRYLDAKTLNMMSLLTNEARSRPCLHGHDRASEEPKGIIPRGLPRKAAAGSGYRARQLCWRSPAVLYLLLFDIQKSQFRCFNNKERF